MMKLAELVAALPGVPDPGDVDEQRAELLALADRLPRRTRRRWPIAAAIAAAAAVAIAVWPRAEAPPAPVAVIPPPVYRGSVHGAQHALVGAQPDEIVRLQEGTIDVEVAPLQRGERFRVVVGDAEVEVRGTAFEVEAAHDALVAVRVRHGRVEVRRRDEAPVVLGAGDAWPRPAPTVATAAPPPPQQPHPTATVPPAELAFRSGIAAMRDGDLTVAARAFERALRSQPAGALAADAQYWLAVARARAGDAAGAIEAFEQFLARYPHAPRAGKASAMLGWLLVDANRRDEALQRFRAAAADPDDQVRASAAAGLRDAQPAPR